ncbi:hypothetical protein V1J52_10600 [Streptomyces sp. TRM 70351]|uniref:hypothetical protein n=1 Tax=Streptomyces sp. TRM 70351 TaxID=3116552 RepID=UPI002E7B8F0F|nr:hypothetical protein [Streptomyces sp. TRM 70351]MEE1928638.1 hypothetical protein [Streptomyces sp. TRM 70351]
MAAPLLAQFAGAASAAADDTWGTVSDGWVEIRWTGQVREEMDRLGAVVEAVAPARLVTDTRGTAVRFPVRAGKGDPSVRRLSDVEGDSALEGGITVSTPRGEFRIVALHGVLRDGVASGRCTANGVEVGHRSVFRCGLDEGSLTTSGAPAGQPLRVRVSEVPLHATPELMEAYVATFGEPVFTAGTLLGYVTAEGVYTPPKP